MGSPEQKQWIRTNKEAYLSVRPLEFCRAQPCDDENLRPLQVEYKEKLMAASLINLVKPTKFSLKHKDKDPLN